jgi:hypothetical protein
MRKLIAICAVFVLLLGAMPVTGWAEDQQEAPDVLEVNIFGGLGFPMGGVKTWSDSLGAKTGYNLGFHVGYFFTPNLVVGGTFTYDRFGIDTKDVYETQHHQLYSPAVYVKYHFFGGSDLVPFVEGQAGVDFVKFSATVVDRGVPIYREIGFKPAAAVGIGAGLFYYTSDFGGLFVQAGYHHGFTKKAKKDYQGQKLEFGENLDKLSVMAGLQVFFGGK